MKRRFWLSLIVCFVVWGETSLFAASFHHNEKRYTITYDSAKYSLVSPGMLSTDLIIRGLVAENGFYPNITIKSQEHASLDALPSMTESVRTVIEYYQKALQNAVVMKQSAVTWKGSPAYLIDVRYTRDTYDLYLRTLLVQTPRLAMTINLTSPFESRSANIAALMTMVDSVVIEP